MNVSQLFSCFAVSQLNVSGDDVPSAPFIHRLESQQVVAGWITLKNGRRRGDMEQLQNRAYHREMRRSGRVG